MKKLLLKAFVYLLVLVSIPYLYFLWHAKQGLDAFLTYHSFGGELTYEWMLIDLNGRILLFDASFHHDPHHPLFSSEKIEIIPTSIFDWLNAREKVVYQEYPSHIKINVSGAKTNQAEKLLSLFDLEYTEDIFNLFYPTQCLDIVDYKLPPFSFNLSTQLSINRTADKTQIKLEFRSPSMASVNSSLTINNFSEGRTDESFVSDLSIQLNDLLWLQQNISKCISSTLFSNEEFTQNLLQKLVVKSKQNGLIINHKAAKAIGDFLYIPQNINLDFDLKTNKKLSQIPLNPIHLYQQKTGLSIQLNNQDLGMIFNEVAEPVIKTKLTETITLTKILEKDAYKKLPVNSSLDEYLGSKILIRLNNKAEAAGYLAEVNQKGLKINQLKFKGKTVLPYSFDEIESIKLLREN